MARPISSATFSTWVMSAEPSSPWGVPTATKRISLDRTAAERSVENESRSSATFREIISSSPGS